MHQLREQPPLFNGAQLNDWLQHRYDDAVVLVTVWDADRLLQMSDSDIADLIFEDYSVQWPSLDEAGLTMKPAEQRLLFDGFGRGSSVTLWSFTVPYQGMTEVFSLDCGLRFMTPTKGVVTGTAASGGELTIEITSNDRPPATTGEMIRKELDNRLAMVTRILNHAKPTADGHNQRIRELESFVAKRRLSILADRALEASLGVPVRRRDGAASFVVPVKRKSVKAQLSTPPGTTFSPEPLLGKEVYDEILRILEWSILQLERTPDIAKDFDEEAIRNLLLINLNGQMELVAGGEMFNHVGKTDILVREGEKNVFIGECKVWDGPKVVADGLTQLFSYLVWRDTQAAFLLFIRKGEPTEVIGKAIATIRAHELYKRDVRISLDGTRSDFMFRSSEDPAKQVRLAFFPFVLKAAV